MTNSIKDQVVCLGHRKYSETSQIVTLFGRSSGKIQAIAKGARRARAKFSGGIDVLSSGQAVFIRPGPDATLATLTEFSLEESFQLLRRNLLGLNCGEFMASITADFTEQFDPHQRLYDALIYSLDSLQHTARPEAVLVDFEMLLLGEVGLKPIWQRCCLCGRELPKVGKLYFSSGSGGMLCGDCNSAVSEKRLVDRDALAVLQHPETTQTADTQNVIKAHGTLCYHQRELLGKHSTVMKFLNQLLLKRGFPDERQQRS